MHFYWKETEQNHNRKRGRTRDASSTNTTTNTPTYIVCWALPLEMKDIFGLGVWNINEEVEYGHFQNGRWFCRDYVSYRKWKPLPSP